jgi:hypothetical protein
MKRFSLIAILVIVALAIPQPSQGASKAKAGAKCTKAGATQLVNGKKFNCLKLGSKLYWDNGKANTAPGDSLVNSELPSIGNCFDYRWADTNKVEILSQVVNCKLAHTAETYLVAKWTSTLNPYFDSRENISLVAKSLCGPLPYQGSILNQLVFSFSSKSEWAKNSRWIRCDGVSVDNVLNPQSLVKWTNKPPAQLAIPATCLVEETRYSHWTDGEYNDYTTFGVRVRNTSPNMDAVNVRIVVTYTDRQGRKQERVEISRIPAMQVVGTGKQYWTAGAPSAATISANCSSAPGVKNLKLSTGGGPLLPHNCGAGYCGLIWVAQIANPYQEAIRCKSEDGYGCLIYIVFLNGDGLLVGGTTAKFEGTVYPGESQEIFTLLQDLPQAFYPRDFASVQYWIQEPIS